MPKKKTVPLKNATMLVTVKAPADMPAKEVRRIVKAMAQSLSIQAVKVTAYAPKASIVDADVS